MQGEFRSGPRTRVGVFLFLFICFGLFPKTFAQSINGDFETIATIDLPRSPTPEYVAENFAIVEKTLCLYEQTPNSPLKPPRVILFDMSEPESIVEIGAFTPSTEVGDFILEMKSNDEALFFIGTPFGRLVSYDVLSNPSTPARSDSVTTRVRSGDRPLTLDVENNLAAVGNHWSELVIFDVSNPSEIVRTSTYDPLDHVRTTSLIGNDIDIVPVDLVGDTAFISYFGTNNNGSQSIDLSDPTAPEYRPGLRQGVLNQGILYTNGEVWPADNPFTDNPLATYPGRIDIVADSLAYGGVGSTTLTAYSARNPIQPRLTSQRSLPNPIKQIEAMGNHVLILDSSNLTILKHTPPPNVFRVSKRGNNLDGTTWRNAFTTVQGAMVEAASGDEIWVAEGVYEEYFEMKPGVSILGGFTGKGIDKGEDFATRDWLKHPTVVSSKDYPTSAIRAADGCFLEGLTVIGGKTDRGGGVRMEGGKLEISDCILRGGNAMGGGLHAVGSEVSLIRCRIANNSHTDVTSARGGGIYCENSSLNLTECHVEDNGLSAVGKSLGLGNLTGAGAGGGGIYADDSKLEIDGSRISGNGASARSIASSFDFSGGASASGGGIQLSGSSEMRMTNSILDRNRIGADYFPHHYIGGRIVYPGHFGSGLAVSASSTAELVHSTIVSNTASRNLYFGQIPSKQIDYASRVALVNSAVVESSSIEGTGFANAEGSDYRLNIDSPFLDGGEDAGVEVDIDGNPRPVDLAGYGNEGSSVFDLGAYERQSAEPLPTLTPSPTPPGPTPTHPPLPLCLDPRADISGDGLVNCDDMLILLENWMRDCHTVP